MTWGQLAASISGVKAATPINLFTLAGTWAGPEDGYPADVARAVDQDLYNWIPIDYPASFGPIPPATSPTMPSYQESVAIGVQNVVAAVNGSTGKWALGGYSQGAEGISRAFIALQGSPRMADFVGAFTLGNPCREQGHTFPGNTDPGGHGIAQTRMSKTPEQWWDFAHSGDLYANVPTGEAGDDCTAVYMELTLIQVHDMVQLAESMVNAFTEPGGLGEQIEKLLTNPLNLIHAGQAAAFALQFVASNPPTWAHISYDQDDPLGDGRTSLQIAIDHMNDLGHRSLGV